MSQMIMGALAMAFAVAGLCFLRFWRDTRERLFAFFALAFFMLAASRIAFVFHAPDDGRGEYLYWVRFLAFLLILAAILDKNRTRKPPST